MGYRSHIRHDRRQSVVYQVAEAAIRLFLRGLSTPLPPQLPQNQLFATIEALMSELVFAYGSNMCSGRLRDYGLSPEAPGTGALLAGYHLLFNKHSTDGSGKANVEVRETSHVWGVLYAIPDTDLQTLDAGEVDYRRMRLPIRTTGNTDS